MYMRIDPSGCCERKGMVRVRFSMYLEPGDYGYEVHHIQVPITPPGTSEHLIDDKEWRARQPKKWVNGFFQVHFILIEPDTPDSEIMEMGEAFLQEAYIKWATGDSPEIINPPVGFPLTVSPARLKVCNDKVKHLTEIGNGSN